MDYEWNEKANSQKRQNKKMKKKQNINVKMLHAKKTLREMDIWFKQKKLGLIWTMNELEKQFEKNLIPKMEKAVKITVKLPHVNKNPLARKRIFVQTPFSHCTLKLKRNFTPQNHSLFRSISCFGVTKINTPIWFQKSWKCEQIFKKAPQYNSNSLICKNIAEPVLKNNPKSWMKILELLYQTSRPIEQCQPKRKQNHLKTWETNNQTN